jgi:polysaccharide pyruvyl transferase WcaK-like protein
MVYAVSAGPLKTAAAQDLVRRALGQATVVTVRERGAKKVLENIGVHREILVTADPALLLRPEPVPDADLAREGLDTGDRLVAMSVREPGPAAPDIDQDLYHSLLADAADFLIDRLAARIVFLPMERGMKDLQHAHAVIARMLRPQRAWVLRGEYSPGQVLDLMRRFDFAVGMRLHFLIFAAIQRVPFVALPYSTKVQSFLDDLQLVMPPLNLVNAGRLLAHIDQFWDGREAVRARIDSLLPDLQRRAEDNTRIALDLLRRTGPAGADGDRPAAGCPA